MRFLLIILLSFSAYLGANPIVANDLYYQTEFVGGHRTVQWKEADSVGGFGQLGAFVQLNRFLMLGPSFSYIVFDSDTLGEGNDDARGYDFNVEAKLLTPRVRVLGARWSLFTRVGGILYSHYEMHSTTSDDQEQFALTGAPREEGVQYKYSFKREGGRGSAGIDGLTSSRFGFSAEYALARESWTTKRISYAHKEKDLNRSYSGIVSREILVGINFLK